MPPLGRTNVPSLLRQCSGKPTAPRRAPIAKSEDDLRLPDESDDLASPGGVVPSGNFSSSDDEEYFKARDLKPSIIKAKKSPDSFANGSDNLKAGAQPNPRSSLGQRHSTRATGRSASRKRAINTDYESIEDDDEVAAKKTKAKATPPPLDVGHHMDVERTIHRRTILKPGYGKKSKGSNGRKRLASSEKLESPKFKMPSLEMDERSPSPQFRRPSKHLFGSSPPPELSSKGSGPPQPRGRGQSQKWQGKRGKRVLLDRKAKLEESSPTPQFKMHLEMSEYESAKAADSTDEDTTPVEPATRKTRVVGPGMALCPVCEEQVDEKLLNDFSEGQKMGFQRKSKFCDLHNKKSAEKDWVERGYPKIDWAQIEQRIEKHHDYLADVIRGQASYYGDQFRENIKAHKNRTFAETDVYPTPGYYGLKGMKIMGESIMKQFARLIREKAPDNKLISGSGAPIFVYYVLMPELAVRLVQEDMSLKIEEARKTVEESRRIGELLNNGDDCSTHTPTAVQDEQPDEHDHGSEPELPVISSRLEGSGKTKATTVLEQDIPGFLKAAVAQARGQTTVNNLKDDDSGSDLSSIASLSDLGVNKKTPFVKSASKPTKRDFKKQGDSDSESSSLSSLDGAGSGSRPMCSSALVNMPASVSTHEADDDAGDDSDLASVGDL